MRGYLQRVWAMISPFREEATPLMDKHRDLEAYGHTDSDTILLVCDLPDMPPHMQPPHTHTHPPHTHTRASPFSEDHFPLRAFRPTSNA